jgi:hypothetical protein
VIILANDNKYISKSNFIYIWNSIWQFIASRFVKKEVGKGLSSNDYTSEEKNKLSEIEPKANKTIVENVFSSTSTTNALSANKGKELNDKFEELLQSVGTDEIYILTENETENDIPKDAVVAIFPKEDAEKIDWTNYYTKPEIDDIIIKADFKKGQSAYELAVEQGFEGSKEEWLAFLKGKDGYTPQKGVDYFDGYTPQKNIDYFDGKDGYTPVKGVDYNDGEDGHTPIKGVDYTDGYTPQRGIDYWTNDDITLIQTYVDNLVSQLVDSAPETLNTLWELANALGNDPNFATTVANEIGKKVDAVQGKGLSSNDYTSAEKSKLASIAEGANNYTHPLKHPASMIEGLATVATTGSYNSLSDKPTIPTIPSSLPANGGNADTVDNKHIVVATSAPTINDANIITFVI